MVDWIKTNKNSGSGNDKVSIQADSSNTFGRRGTTIQIKTSGNKIKILKIYQKAEDNMQVLTVILNKDLKISDILLDGVSEGTSFEGIKAFLFSLLGRNELYVQVKQEYEEGNSSIRKKLPVIEFGGEYNTDSGTFISFILKAESIKTAINSLGFADEKTIITINLDTSTVSSEEDIIAKNKTIYIKTKSSGIGGLADKVIVNNVGYTDIPKGISYITEAVKRGNCNSIFLQSIENRQEYKIPLVSVMAPNYGTVTKLEGYRVSSTKIIIYTIEMDESRITISQTSKSL